LAWTDFDALARGTGSARIVRELRSIERSRRLLLLRAIIDEAAKSSDLSTPLPPADAAWDLLARAEHAAPAVLDLVIAHPYTGSWAGYTARLLGRRIAGAGPLWAHVGHVHAIAAAAAIRAGIGFHTVVPVWQGHANLPTLGTARIPADEPWTVAELWGRRGAVEIDTGTTTVRLPGDMTVDAPNWLAVRRITVGAGDDALAIRLDDVDPYRGPYEPLLPQRIDDAEVDAWHGLLAGAWRLIRQCLPDIADAMRFGFDSLVPRPAVAFRTPSASSDEAFGSAIAARPPTAPVLAAMLVHEFQHNMLGALLRLVRLSEPDTRARFYAAWRDDPRPVEGMMQGLYAFFGVTAFWRALARRTDRLAAFEFAYHRTVTWRAVTTMRRDPALTESGRRFITGMADVLGPWQDESVPVDIAEMAVRAADDHYLGWRIRYLRPAPDLIADLANAWLDNRSPARSSPGDDEISAIVPDGGWSHARADLYRLVLAGDGRQPSPAEALSSVPDATLADLALVAGRFVDATRGYRAELADDPDRATSWAGLALALAALATSPASRLLTHRPELVRSVHRAIRMRTADAPTPDELTEWLGRVVR
jgi:HEXXH motif-containing protein